MRPPTPSRTLLFIAGLTGLFLLAAAGPTTIQDHCDSAGIRNISDICAVIVDPAVVAEEGTSPRLEAVTFTMVVRGDTDDWAPGDMWDIMWRHGGCTWAIRWFHDPGSDLPDELTTRLDRNCDGTGARGFELAPPTLEGTTLSSEVSIEDFRRIDPDIGVGSVFEGLKAHTYLAIGWQPPAQAYSEYVMVSHESDDTEGANVILE